MTNGAAAAAAILCLVLMLSSAAGERRLSLLLIGHVVPSYNPVTTFLDPDPSVRYTVVPTSESHALPLTESEAKRFVKQYFPRTYEGLSSYDFIMYSIPYILPLTNRQITWLREAVKEGSCPSLTDQGGLRMDVQYAEFWVNAGMSDLFANDAEKVLQSGRVAYSQAGYHLSVNRNAQHQVLLPLVPLGLERIPALGLFHTIPKEGAITIAWAKGHFGELPEAPDHAPWLMFYQYGKGSTWTLCDNFVNPFWCGMYYGRVQGELQTDVLMNIIWHSAGRSLPADAMLVHRMRIEFREYIERRSLQVSVVEFVDRLGANLAPVERVLKEADQTKSESEELYLDQRYEEASSRLSMAFDLLSQAADISLKQKRRALFWVYLIEWAAVSATLMICGVAVYTLMVRRRYYRDVTTTRII